MKIIERTRREERRKVGRQGRREKVEDEGWGTEDRRLVEMEGRVLFCSVPSGRGPAYSGPMR